MHGRRGQILLPAVMLGPLFILLIYLLFEMSKLSMTKVRQQFALDSSAYSQMSTTSGYLNALAQVNGPLPYRVMKTMTTELPMKQTGTAWNGNGKPTVFDVFDQAGAFLSMKGGTSAPSPAAEDTDWGLAYAGKGRADWNKEDPKDMPVQEDVVEEKDGIKYYVVTSKQIADNYFFGASGIGVAAMKEYLTIYARTGSIYQSQKYVYDDTVKNSRMFRESYFLNTKDCRRSECGQEAAKVLDRYILDSKAFEIGNKTGDDKYGLRFYVSADYKGSTMHSGAFPVDLLMSKIIKAPLFQFAYLTPSSRTKLRQMSRGIHLKQKYTVPANRFNINLTQKYKPVVQNSVSVSCPRGGNNCVWPNPIPKYSVKVGI